MGIAGGAFGAIDLEDDATVAAESQRAAGVPGIDGAAASVAEAAERCGYSSPSAFYKAVKICLSQSPSDLKRKNK